MQLLSRFTIIAEIAEETSVSSHACRVPCGLKRKMSGLANQPKNGQTGYYFSAGGNVYH